MPNHPLEAPVREYIFDHLPKRLAEIMEARGLNLDKLSEMSGIHTNTIRAYLAAERIPRIAQLFLLSDAVDVPIDWLTGFGDWPGYRESDLTDPYGEGNIH